MRWLSRLGTPCVLVLLAVAAGGCGKSSKSTPSGGSNANANANGTGTNAAAPAKDEIPPDQLGPIMEANRRGLGLMEQYRYGEAAEAFREVHRRAPGWIAGSINLAIALLNDTGLKIEEAKKKGDAPPPEALAGGDTPLNFRDALALLDEVLKREPGNLHAHFCRGVILNQIGETERAFTEFRAVTEKDPDDGHAWYWAGKTMPDAIEKPAEQVRLFEKALACNPYLDSALYGLAMAYRLVEPKKTPEMLARWNRIKVDRQNDTPGPGDQFAIVYGEMGKYAQVIDPGPPRVPPSGRAPAPLFDAPTALDVTLPDGQRWAAAADFTGRAAIYARARARFGAAVASIDADGDGKADLLLAAAAVGPEGVHDVLLLNRGDGKFEDATAAFGLPADRASLGIAAADFDADGRPDLLLTGVGDNRLYRNAGKKFEDVTEAAGLVGSKAITLTARWLDLDQDGDLDLYLVNFAGADDADAAFTDATPPGAANAAYRNDGVPVAADGAKGTWSPSNWAPPATAKDPQLVTGTGLSVAFAPWPDAGGLIGETAAHTGVAALDLDDDRDLDLVLVADGADPVAVLNDRLGRFRAVTLVGPDARSRFDGLLATHLDRDGRADLVVLTTGGGVATWRNVTSRSATASTYATEVWPSDLRGWRSAIAADLDLDGWADLLGLPGGPEASSPVWARNEGDRLDARTLGLGADPAPLAGLALVDLAGDPLPDLVLVKDGAAPQLARNRGNGHHWLALDLGGRWNVKPKMMRTNAQGLGARLTLEGDGLGVPYSHLPAEAGPAQSVGPAVLGLGKAPQAQLVRLTWPDGVMQCELNVAADQRLALVENNRKEGSCPVLFTWDGQRFVCLGDFLGGGGLGYLVAPGVYGEPDRDEAVGIAPEQLRPVDGILRLAIVEPMSEVAYLDRLRLDAVDLPPGWSATPDERFAPGGNRPTGELVAWKDAIQPVRATDLRGRDVTGALRAWDRRGVDDFALRDGWIGYAERHGIVLDFGDRLARFGPGDRLVLALAGAVEYPYSQTNYAAATAGLPLEPPVLERRRPDGTWEVIEPDPGYPAGMPRLTTLDLTGKLAGPRCVLRLTTNMDLIWDQAFVAVAGPADTGRVTSLDVARATLGYRGYLREVSPDGRRPSTYDYDNPDPAPLARLNGRLTRYGDVAPLLHNDDDQLCIVGPGDEVRLEFDAEGLPPLAEGWTRRYVLRSVGYCKDADPFTATSDTVGPLPWRGMGRFPFGPDGEHPPDPTYRAYLRDYQTRMSVQK